MERHTFHTKLFYIVVLLMVIIISCHSTNPQHRGLFYVIGTGPSGPQMATLQALSAIKKADIIIASGLHTKLFSDYIKNKPVLFDPWQGFFDYKGKRYTALNNDEFAAFKTECFRIRDEKVKRIKQLLSEGKNVGLLDGGNPFLFGPSNWYIEQFDKQDLVVIPGMGCDAAALSALGRSIMPAHDSRCVIQTAPFFLKDWNVRDSILKDLSKYPVSMINYMALDDPDKLFQDLKIMFPDDMPCAVVFWAGYPDKQYIVEGTIGDMAPKLAHEKERYMGLLFVGRFLDGKPYENAMNNSLSKMKTGE